MKRYADLRSEFANSKRDLYIFELQDEFIDDLLDSLKSLYSNKSNAPVVCLDSLQMISSDCGIDDFVRRLKKFQHVTNTTFLVISDLTELNNIKSLFDTIWILQSLEKLQPRKISFNCLKSRQGTNSECSFFYHSAHDGFVSCNYFNDDDFIP